MLFLMLSMLVSPKEKLIHLHATHPGFPCSFMSRVVLKVDLIIQFSSFSLILCAWCQFPPSLPYFY